MDICICVCIYIAGYILHDNACIYNEVGKELIRETHPCLKFDNVLTCRVENMMLLHFWYKIININ